jgi:hypothetical protein
MFQAVGLHYVAADRVKSDLYRDLLPLLTSRRVELLDHPRLVTQLIRLERHASRMGREVITHPPQSHDDLANAAAGALVFAAGRRRGVPAFAGLAEYLREHPEAATPEKPAPLAWTAHEVIGTLAIPLRRSLITCSSCHASDDGSTGWIVYPSVTCPRCQIRRPDEA